MQKYYLIKILKVLVQITHLIEETLQLALIIKMTTSHNQMIKFHNLQLLQLL